MRIALLFKSFGPYHIARLRAARSKASILALEFADVDRDYDWDVSGEKLSSKIISLSATTDGQNHPVKSRARLKMNLENKLRSFVPDAVAIPGYSEPPCLLAAWLCRNLGIPTILMSDSHDSGKNRNRLRETLKRRVLPLFDAAFVAGTPHIDYLVRLGFPRDRITTGYDVVDNWHFAATKAPAKCGTSTEVPTNYFFCCSRFIEGKNLQFLIDAFIQYRRRTQKDAWDLVIAGDGPLYAPLSRYVQDLLLTRHVHLVGRKNYSDLPHFYASAGAFVFPSLSETWGLVVNEAMAAGLPVLVSKTAGCQQDLIRNGVNGYVFDPTDLNQLASQLFSIAHAADRKTMGEASLRTIRQWDLDRFASGLIDAASIASAANVPTRLKAITAAIATALSYRV